MKKKNIVLIIILILVVLVLFLSIDAILKIKSTQTASGEISNFEECIEAGNPAMESYPRKCRDPKTGNTFIEVIDDVWNLDGVILMQNTETGEIECFGCNEARDGEPALCKDPANVVQEIPETEDRYCDNDFEVVEIINGVACGNNICEEGEADREGGCGPDADPRCLGPPDYSGTCPQDCIVLDCPPEYENTEACDDVLEPVCGLVEVQCVTAPCNPVKETFRNKCYACIKDSVNEYINGACV